MERLTHRYTDGRAWTSMNNVAAYGEYECVGPAIDRLAAYEDNGIEPGWIKIMEGHAEDMETLLDIFGHLDCDKPFFARMEEIAQAEKDGRLVVLPCRLHKPIYFTDDGELFEDTPYEVSLGQSPGERNDTLLYICEEGFDFYGDDIGKTVFLTREEAEAALNTREGDTKC